MNRNPLAARLPSAGCHREISGAVSPALLAARAHARSLAARRPIAKLKADMKAAGVLDARGVLKDTELAVIGPSNATKTVTVDKLISVAHLEAADGLPCKNVNDADLDCVKRHIAAGLSEEQMVILHAPGGAYDDARPIAQMKGKAGVLNTYRDVVTNALRLPAPLYGGQGASGAVGSEANTIRLPSSTNRPQLAITFDTAGFFRNVFTSYAYAVKCNNPCKKAERHRRQQLLQLVLADGVDLTQTSNLYNSMDEAAQGTFALPLQPALGQDWLGKTMLLHCNVDSAYGAAALLHDVVRLLTSSRLPTLLLQAEGTSSEQALQRLCQMMDEQDVAGNGRWQRLLQYPKVRQALSYAIKGGMVELYEPGEPDPVAVIDTMGINDSDPNHRAKFLDACNRPDLRHVVLLTDKRHDQKSMQELLVNPVFHKYVDYSLACMEGREASVLPASAAAVITREIGGYEEQLILVEHLQNAELCAGIMASNAAGEEEFRKNLKLMIDSAGYEHPVHGGLTNEQADYVVDHMWVVMGLPLVGHTLAVQLPGWALNNPKARDAALAATGYERVCQIFFDPVLLAARDRLQDRIQHIQQQQQANGAAAMPAAVPPAGCAVAEWLQPLVQRDLLKRDAARAPVLRQLDGGPGTLVTELSNACTPFIRNEYLPVLQQLLRQAAANAAGRVVLDNYTLEQLLQRLQPDRRLAEFQAAFLAFLRAELESLSAADVMRRKVLGFCDSQVLALVTTCLKQVQHEIASTLRLHEDTPQARAAIAELAAGTQGAGVAGGATAAGAGTSAAAAAAAAAAGCGAGTSAAAAAGRAGFQAGTRRTHSGHPALLAQTEQLFDAMAAEYDVAKHFSDLRRKVFFYGLTQEERQLRYLVDKVLLPWFPHLWNTAVSGVHRAGFTPNPSHSDEEQLQTARAKLRQTLRDVAEHIASRAASRVSDGLNSLMVGGGPKSLQTKLLSNALLPRSNSRSKPSKASRYNSQSPIIGPIKLLSSKGAALLGSTQRGSSSAAQQQQQQLAEQARQMQQLQEQEQELQLLQGVIEAYLAQGQEEQVLPDFVGRPEVAAAGYDVIIKAAAVQAGDEEDEPQQQQQQQQQVLAGAADCGVAGTGAGGGGGGALAAAAAAAAGAGGAASGAAAAAVGAGAAVGARGNEVAAAVAAPPAAVAAAPAAAAGAGRERGHNKRSHDALGVPAAAAAAASTSSGQGGSSLQRAWAAAGDWAGMCPSESVNAAAVLPVAARQAAQPMRSHSATTTSASRSDSKRQRK